MYKLYPYFVFLFIAHNCSSQKIIQEKLYDNIPDSRNVLNNENDFGDHLFITDVDDKIILKKKPLYRLLSGRGQICIDSNDGGFIFIKFINEWHKHLEQNFYVKKFNENFEEEWTKEIPKSHIYSKLENGISYKNGSYTLLFNRSGRSLEVFHFDATGDILWNTTIKNKLITINSLLATKDDGILLVGHKRIVCTDCCLEYEYLVIKMDCMGNTLWTKTYTGSGSSKANCSIETNEGDFIIGGSTYSTEGEYKYMHNPLENAGSKEIGIFKIDKDGKLIWNKYYGGTGTELCNSLLLTNDGRIVVLAWTRSSSGDVFKNNGSNDIWVVQLNSNGDLIWEETYGGKHSDAGQKMEIDKNNIITILGSKEITPQQKVLWLFKIDDSFDISKPETHGIERRKHIIKDLENIKNETDIDRFIKYMFPYTYGWGGDSYLKHMNSVQWFVEDFNNDGKQDLLVYGIDQEEKQTLYIIESKTDDAYERNILMYGYDIKYIFNIDSTDEDIKIILEANPEKEKDIPGFTYPKIEDIDTLVYKHGAFINYNKNPINAKEIEYVQLSFSGHHMIGATIRLYANGEVKAFRSNYKSEKRELVSIKEWEISKEEQKSIFNIVSELKFPNPNEPKKSIMWMDHSTMYLSLQMKSGEILGFPNDSYFPSKTIDRISEICGAYYGVAKKQMMENFKKSRADNK